MPAAHLRAGPSRTSLRSEGGQALAEFALVLPILTVLLFGIVQFGIAFTNSLAVTDATRAGVRAATVARTAPDPAGEAVRAVRQSAPNLDQTLLTVSVTAPSGWRRGAPVTVATSYPFRISLFGAAVRTGRLQSQTTGRIE